MSQEEGAQWQPDGMCQKEGCTPYFLTEGPCGSFVTICPRHYDLRVALYCERRICGWCWKARRPWEKINICSQCKLVAYCSRECQQLDWDHSHALVCSPRCNDCNDLRSCYKVSFPERRVSIRYCLIHLAMSPYVKPN